MTITAIPTVHMLLLLLSVFQLSDGFQPQSPHHSFVEKRNRQIFLSPSSSLTSTASVVPSPQEEEEGSQNHQLIVCTRRHAFRQFICSAGAMSILLPSVARAATDDRNNGPDALTFPRPNGKERPPIPLPRLDASTGSSSMTLPPPLQGTIYCTARDSQRLLQESSISGLGSLFLRVTIQQASSGTVVQAAQFPLRGLSLFPFRFQFSNLASSSSTTLAETDDLIVEAKVLVINDDEPNNRSCSLLYGQGIAKALGLPTAVANGAVSDDEVDDSQLIFIRAPAAVNLLPIATTTPSSDTETIQACSVPMN